VLIYAHDVSAGAKHERAKRLDGQFLRSKQDHLLSKSDMFFVPLACGLHVRRLGGLIVWRVPEKFSEEDPANLGFQRGSHVAVWLKASNWSMLWKSKEYFQRNRDSQVTSTAREGEFLRRLAIPL
jgi:hypothetical protein